MINSLLRIAGVYKAYEKYLIEQIKYGPMPAHIGIILDGNRRWATEKALNSTDGHWAGAKVGEEVLDWCLEYGIKTLTLYTLSTENFSRPSEEVNSILKIVEEETRKEIRPPDWSALQLVAAGRADKDKVYSADKKL